jgi:AcrR family transcriptional regulator
MAADPLFDTLFRSTAHAPNSGESDSVGGADAVDSSLASSAPIHESGTRSRAGNAMGRTRAALLDGARRAVEQSGTKITMAQVAAAAGVAKATLYNHFRTREAVLTALLEHEISTLTTALAGRAALGDALGGAAEAVSGHPVVRTLAELEPATLARLAAVDTGVFGWALAGEHVCELLRTHGRAGGELVLRWLGSFITSPGDSARIADDVAVLLTGLPEARHTPTESVAANSARSA